MEHTEENRRTSPVVIWASLGAAGFFEAATVLATQDKTVRAVSPWQDDPYHAVVSLTQFTVPMLALAIALRLLAWRAPSGQDRMRQTARAAGAMIALVGLTLVFEWAALIGGAHAAAWDTWTAVLTGGLAVTSILTVVMATLLMAHSSFSFAPRTPRPAGPPATSLTRPGRSLLVRRYRSGGSRGQWRHDWLGDVVFLCGRIPVLRRWVTPDAAAWVRRRAMTVFVTLSALAAIGITAAQAIGERWTNPLLIAWMLVVEMASYLSFCVISNAVAGFIARPPRGRRRRAAEASVIAGCVAIQVAVTFRAVLGPAIGVTALTSVPAVAALTLGAGLVTAVLSAGLLLGRARWPDTHPGKAGR